MEALGSWIVFTGSFANAVICELKLNRTCFAELQDGGFLPDVYQYKFSCRIKLQVLLTLHLKVHYLILITI